MRLQKYIADCGVTSRRKAEDLIVEGVVTVNGEVVNELGSKVNPVEDTVQVKGEVIDRDSVDKIYAVLNKPRGIISSVSDPEGRETVVDICRGIKTRVYPVGRLDYLSEGLLIMTNDGEFSNKILHPSYEVTKVYEVKVFGILNEKILTKVRQGIRSEGELLKPLSVRVLKQFQTKTWLEFRLNEGKNREIRRICEACGLTIDKLKRVAIGGLSLDGIKPGKYGLFTKGEIFKLIGLDRDGIKIHRKMEYVSHKKSVSKRKRDKFKSRRGEVANSEKFGIFKKENYNDTIQRRKDLEKERVVAALNAEETQLSKTSISRP